MASKFGAVRFKRDAVASYPIPYRVESGGGWIKRFAAPVGDPNAPLAVLDSALEFEQMPVPVLIAVREGQKPRQGVNTCGANSVFIFNHAPKDVPQEFVFPLITKECFDEPHPTPRKHILLPYDRRTGRPLDDVALERQTSLATYFSSQKSQLLARKGTMLNTWMKRGMWWACLGVGEYCFAPFKVVWEAYGKSNFSPRIFGCVDGQPWQADQAMQAFIPVRRWPRRRIARPAGEFNIESYLKSLSVEGTCSGHSPVALSFFSSFPGRRERELRL